MKTKPDDLYYAAIAADEEYSKACAPYRGKWDKNPRIAQEAWVDATKDPDPYLEKIRRELP